MLPEHQTRRRFLEALTDTHFADALPQSVLDALQQPLALLELRVVLLAIGSALQPGELQVATRGILEALAFVALDVSHDPFVDALGEQQHLDAALLELLDRGAAACRGDALGDDVVDTLLPGLHAAEVVGEAHRRGIILPRGAGEAQQREDRAVVGVILCDTLLENRAELLPESG